MNHRALVLLIGAATGAAAFPAAAGPAMRNPDAIILKDGSTVRGLIVANVRDSVTIQEEYGERTIPKSEIVRIRDEADTGTYFTDPGRKGDLPSWRAIVNDLRTMDEVKSLEQIPATVIDNGEFKNVPYVSFRLNKGVELNIYGDPNDPAGLELGIYGSRSGDRKLRKTLRAFLAGYLASRAEIAALYAVDLDEGLITIGDMVIEVTPKDAPDAYGAWWISLYYPKELAAVRLSDAAYTRLTIPAAEILRKDGSVADDAWDREDARHSTRLMQDGEDERLFVRGFYRDKSGQFRLLVGQ
jgi:hypothetical protein